MPTFDEFLTTQEEQTPTPSTSFTDFLSTEEKKAESTLKPSVSFSDFLDTTEKGMMAQPLVPEQAGPVAQARMAGVEASGRKRSNSALIDNLIGLGERLLGGGAGAAAGITGTLEVASEKIGTFLGNLTGAHEAFKTKGTFGKIAADYAAKQAYYSHAGQQGLAGDLYGAAGAAAIEVPKIIML